MCLKQRWPTQPYKSHTPAGFLTYRLDNSFHLQAPGRQLLLPRERGFQGKPIVNLPKHSSLTMNTITCFLNSSTWSSSFSPAQSGQSTFPGWEPRAPGFHPNLLHTLAANVPSESSRSVIDEAKRMTSSAKNRDGVLCPLTPAAPRGSVYENYEQNPWQKAEPS